MRGSGRKLKSMRNPPRFALVPLAVLIAIVPFTFSPFVGPAGADTTADCEAAFSGGSSTGLAYTTDPSSRLAYSRQTVRLSGAWDPAAWESLSSALACVRVDDSFDGVLGVIETAPANSGAFEHSFTIPDSAPGTRLCTRIRIDGDPAGEATAATWVTKQHCFEVDHHEEQIPPSDDETTPTTSAPSTTSTTAPATAPADSSGNPDNPPAPPQVEAPAPPFDTAGDVPPPGAGSDTPAPAGPATPEYIPLLPATGAGSTSLSLLHYGELAFFTGLATLVLFGRPRRRRQTD
jgi:hypothetical protein